MNSPSTKKTSLPLLCLGVLGVVYGDIGTSPLYTVSQIFNNNIAPTHDNVLGILSLIFWSLVMVVTVKYTIFILRADNRGEGGIMALSSLVSRALPKNSRTTMILATLAILGTGLFYGDSMITPAISVLSAVEGFGVADEKFKTLIDPIAIFILTILFLVQHRGTGVVGRIFGPVMVIWFVVLALMGIYQIQRYPSVWQAINPLFAVEFFTTHGLHGFLILGSVVLCVTGAEALYADMGHFGRKPISISWTWFVLPALVLNYFGQGALLLVNPEAVSNPFYHMAPQWAIYPLTGIATLATIIASQAVITGAFSLSYQAMLIGYLPRMTVLHTTASTEGQIYVPIINWALYVGIVLLIIGFHDSSNLANAYGIAVTGTMLVTTLLAYVVMTHLWRWSPWITRPLLAVFLIIDVSFFTSTMAKIFDGGWFPIAVGFLVFLLMATWKKGRALLRERTQEHAIPLKSFLDSLALSPPKTVPGLAVFLSNQPNIVPRSFLHNLSHNKVIHETVVFLTVVTESLPNVPEEQRLEVETLTANAYRVTLHIGFMEQVDIPGAVAAAKLTSKPFNILETSFFLNRETVVPSAIPGMPMWRERLFAWMMRNAQGAMTFFNIPPGRVVELGSQVEI